MLCARPGSPVPSTPERREGLRTCYWEGPSELPLYLDYLPDEEYYSLEDITGEPKKREYLLRCVPGCEVRLP